MGVIGAQSEIPLPSSRWRASRARRSADLASCCQSENRLHRHL